MSKAEKLDNKILETHLKLTYLEKQRKFWLCHLKRLSDQKSYNILEIKDKAAEDILPPTLGSFLLCLDNVLLSTNFSPELFPFLASQLIEMSQVFPTASQVID